MKISKRAGANVSEQNGPKTRDLWSSQVEQEVRKGRVFFAFGIGVFSPRVLFFFLFLFLFSMFSTIQRSSCPQKCNLSFLSFQNCSFRRCNFRKVNFWAFDFWKFDFWKCNFWNCNFWKFGEVWNCLGKFEIVTFGTFQLLKVWLWKV